MSPVGKKMSPGEHASNPPRFGLIPKSLQHLALIYETLPWVVLDSRNKQTILSFSLKQFLVYIKPLLNTYRIEALENKLSLFDSEDWHPNRKISVNVLDVFMFLLLLLEIKKIIFTFIFFSWTWLYVDEKNTKLNNEPRNAREINNLSAMCSVWF